MYETRPGASPVFAAYSPERRLDIFRCGSVKQGGTNQRDLAIVGRGHRMSSWTSSARVAQPESEESSDLRPLALRVHFVPEGHRAWVRPDQRTR